jgi:hypothetical protein
VGGGVCGIAFHGERCREASHGERLGWVRYSSSPGSDGGRDGNQDASPGSERTEASREECGTVPERSRPERQGQRGVTSTVSLDELVPFVEWDQFLLTEMDWQQGEHCAMIGTTGSGKTSLAMHLLPGRKYVTILGTKPVDENLDRFVDEFGFQKFERWPQGRKNNPKKSPRRLIWPNARSLHSDGYQNEVLGEALEFIYIEGGWCVYVDELWFISNILNLGKSVKMYLLQARSLKISLIISTQRPAWVPLEIYDQSTHLFFWLDNDDTNLARISGIGTLPRQVVIQAIESLREHEVLYVNTRTRRMVRTFPPYIIPAPKKVRRNWLGREVKV